MIYVTSGGSGSGSVLTINGVAGSTVTISKSGKTKKKVLDSTGKAVFKGLSDGTWTVTMTKGSQSVTRSITLNSSYEMTIAYFSATITVTYPANSTCTCSDGTTTLTDTNTGTSKKTVTFTVPNTGNWVISCTDGTESTSETVSITVDGQTVTIELSYNLKLFDNGDQCTNTTGGWSNNGYLYDGKKPSPITISDDRILLYGANDTNSGLGTQNSIDLTGYSKLIVDVDIISTLSTYSSAVIRLYSSKTIIVSQAKATLQFGNQLGRKTLELDISNINIPVYIYASVGGNAHYKNDVFAIYAKK